MIEVYVHHKMNVETVLGDGRICYFDNEDQQWSVMQRNLADLIRAIEGRVGVERVQVFTSGEIVDHCEDPLGHRTQWYTLKWNQRVDHVLGEFLND